MASANGSSLKYWYNQSGQKSWLFLWGVPFSYLYSSKICRQSIRMISGRYILLIFFYENNSNLDVMSSVVKLMMYSFFDNNRIFHRIRNRRNELSFVGYYFIIVNNKTVLKTSNMQTVYDEMWCIVEYFIAIFFFLILFDWRKPKKKIYTSCVNCTEPKVEPGIIY